MLLLVRYASVGDDVPQCVWVGIGRPHTQRCRDDDEYRGDEGPHHQANSSRMQSRLVCMFCCHSASRPATIRASFSGLAVIANVSPDGPGPILAHCRTSAPSLVGSTSNAHVAVTPLGPMAFHTQRRPAGVSETSTTSHSVCQAPRASCS